MLWASFSRIWIHNAFIFRFLSKRKSLISKLSQKFIWKNNNPLLKFKFKKLKQLRQSQANLPVYKYKNEILKTIQENQVTIIAGDTGCGKVNIV